MDKDQEYLPPDYTGFPSEEDDIEMDEDELKIEAALDKQETYKQELIEKTQKKEEEMSLPFESPGSSKAPWESNNNNSSSGSSGWWSSNSSPRFGSFGSVSSDKDAPWNKNNENSGKQKTGPTTKGIIICDVLDCLFESYESGGKPNILPRAIFDLKPKFNVWEKIASFNPGLVYILFPSNELVPSFGDPNTSQVALGYVSQCISTYLRIPKTGCVIVRQKGQNIPKAETLKGIVISHKQETDNILYIGVHSGKYGLSNRDKEAAHACGVSYIDLFNLLDNNYIYE